MPPKVRMVAVKTQPKHNKKIQEFNNRLPTPVVLANPETAQTHKERAKRWGMTVWQAEWFANGVEYCTNPQNRPRFEAWVRKGFSRAQAEDIIEEFRKPLTPGRAIAIVGKKNQNHVSMPAYELGIASEDKGTIINNSFPPRTGVSQDMLRLFHQFSGLATQPPRVQPAIKRKRGEPSSEWVLRRNDAMLAGCKTPNIDWEECRKIALSEYDATRDMYEAWHSDLEEYSNGLMKRAISTISFPQPVEVETPQELMQLCTDAFRTRFIYIHIAQAHWFRAAKLFEELARRGLKTSSAIERAYLADPRLKWQLVSCAAFASKLNSRASDQSRQVWAAQPSFKNYFNRYRTRDGRAYIEINSEYCSEHPPPLDSIDRIIMSACTTSTRDSMIQASARAMEAIAKSPEEAKKFEDHAWRDIGDLYNISSFCANFMESDFGFRLSKVAEELPDAELDIFNEEVVFANPLKLSEKITGRPPPGHEHSEQHRLFWRAHEVVEAVCDQWITLIFNPDLNPYPFLANLIQISFFGSDERILKHPEAQRIQRDLIPSFDRIMKHADQFCWEQAASLDPPGRKGLMAKTFGLYNPRDLNRPTSMINTFLRPVEVEGAVDVKPNITPYVAPHYVSSIPVAGPRDSAAQSAHSFIAKKNQVGGADKVKVKTRDESAAPAIPAPEYENLDDEEPFDANYPDALPTTFKMNRKMSKIFHRILEIDPMEENDIGVKKGQVRWQDFERVMRRIGFDVIQTAGSSVRFDPPARTARPITFHRPHPDSLLTPHMIKWIGARLKRCYGWTTSTFLQVESADDVD